MYVKTKQKKRLVLTVEKAQEIVVKKGKVSIPKLAFELGYTSIDYFRRSILPMIIELSGCLEREGNEVIWVCESDD